MTVLIVGGTGSLGKTLVKKYLSYDSKPRVVVLSRDEAKQWTMKNDFAGNRNLSFEIGDVRDRSRIDEVIRTLNPQTVIIAAALKQVDTCELSPMESIKTNILGVENVVSSVNDHLKGSAVCMVSTDKACSPTNVYGMCKSVSERIVLERARRDLYNKYVAVRYGNVLESRGSIIPLFKYQAAHKDALTLTHPDMTRFIMTLDQSVELIENTIKNATSGETWIPRLPAMRIRDLAQIFADMSGKPIKEIGMRPGEKIHESLISDTESFRAAEITKEGKLSAIRGSAETDYYTLYPAYLDLKSHYQIGTYSSEQDVLTKDQLRNLLNGLGVLDMPIEQHEGLAIEEIRK